jgi:hypothetical protein
MTFAKPPVSKAFTTFGCNSTNGSNFNDLFLNNTFSVDSIFNLTTPIVSQPGFSMIFQFSYLWYSAFAVFNVFLIGSVVSLITGRTNSDDLDKDLYIDVFKCFKRKKVRFLF